MFSPDSKFMQIFSRIADLILLNILFLVTSVPVFTIGASLTAMYTLCFRMMRDEDNGLFKPYLTAFKANFKQGTLLWGIFLLAGGPALVYFFRIWQLEGILHYACVPFLLILLLCLMTASYAFPWISQFENSTFQALKNSLLLSISRLPRTLCILIINLLPVIVLLISPDLFVQVSFLWIALYFAAAAYMNTGLLWHVFKPYRNA